MTAEVFDVCLGLIVNATSNKSVVGVFPPLYSPLNNSDTAFGWRGLWQIWVWALWTRTPGGATVSSTALNAVLHCDHAIVPHVLEPCTQTQGLPHVCAGLLGFLCRSATEACQVANGCPFSVCCQLTCSCIGFSMRCIGHARFGRPILQSIGCRYLA